MQGHHEEHQVHLSREYRKGSVSAPTPSSGPSLPMGAQSAHYPHLLLAVTAVRPRVVAWHETTAAGALASVLKTMDFVGLVFLATAQACVHVCVVLELEPRAYCIVGKCSPLGHALARLVLTDFYTNAIFEKLASCKD